MSISYNTIPTIAPNEYSVLNFERNHIPGGLAFYQLRDILCKIPLCSNIYSKTLQYVQLARITQTLKQFLQSITSNQDKQEILNLLAQHMDIYYEDMDPEENDFMDLDMDSDSY